MLCAVFLFVATGILTHAAAQDTSPTPSETNDVVVLACNPFPPSKIEDTHIMPGYDVEILRAAFKARDITLRTPFYPWQRAFYLAQTGQVDGLCSCSYHPEREADFLFSEPLGHDQVGLYALNADLITPINRINDMTDMVVGVVKGYNLEATARQAGLDVIAANSEETLINLLLNNRLDLVFSFRAPMDGKLAEMRKTKADFQAISSKTISRNNYYTCISRRAADPKHILHELNLGLRIITENGTRAGILMRYGIANMNISE